MRIKRYALLATSIVIVGVLAVVAAMAEHGAAADARRVHVADRLSQQKVLAGLTGQYLQFTFLATNSSAQATDWSLRAGDPADVSRLHDFVSDSPLTSYGAALVDLLGTPLSAYPSAAALPPQTDPGYGPLRGALLSGKPGLSSVMTVKGRAVVAFGVPVMRSGKPAAILIAYADVRTWPLEGYVQKLALGPTAHAFTLDDKGVVAAAVDPKLLGHKLSGDPLLPQVVAGHTGTATFDRSGGKTFVTYGSAGFAGWSALTEQSNDVFLGSLPQSHNRDVMALLALLCFAVIMLVLFHHRRQLTLQTLAEERLYDPLTGLGQRRLFEISLDAAVSRHRRSGVPLSVLFCDLDEFKPVNDRLGHNAGDQLLVTVAERLRAAARDVDTVVRIGGDEFALIVEGTPDVEATSAVIDRLQTAVERETVVAGERLVPAISVGGALLAPGGSPDELLHEADLAMYAAKARRASHHVNVVGPSLNSAQDRVDHRQVGSTR